MRHRLVIAILALATIPACGGGGTDAKTTVDGTWTGQTGGQLLTLSLVQSGSGVTGSGTMTNTPTGTRALTVSGSFSNPTFTATLSSGSAEPINISANVTGKTMTGSLNGSGFTGDAITLSRP